MFNYGERTAVDVSFKLKELLQTLKANKQIKDDAKVIEEVKLSHTLSEETTGLVPSLNVQEIYIIDLVLNSKNVPNQVISAFNGYIEFQTLFRVHFKDEVNYLVSLKEFNEEKMKIVASYESGWKAPTKFELPITTKLNKIFNAIVAQVVGVEFRDNETFLAYSERQIKIAKQYREIEKLTKTMNNEKQPNIRMAMNDKVKSMKKELLKLEF